MTASAQVVLFEYSLYSHTALSMCSSHRQELISLVRNVSSLETYRASYKPKLPLKEAPTARRWTLESYCGCVLYARQGLLPLRNLLIHHYRPRLHRHYLGLANCYPHNRVPIALPVKAQTIGEHSKLRIKMRVAQTRQAKPCEIATLPRVKPASFRKPEPVQVSNHISFIVMTLLSLFLRDQVEVQNFNMLFRGYICGLKSIMII